MKISLLTIQQWFKMRGARERIFLFLLGFALIYTFFTLLFIRPATLREKELFNQTNALQLQKGNLESQVSSIKVAVKDPQLLKILLQQKKIVTKTAALDQKIAQLKPLFITDAEFKKFFEMVYSYKHPGFKLVNIKKFQKQSWSPSIKDKAYLKTLTDLEIEEHGIEMSIESDYFTMIAYLSWLKKLPWNLYLDSLEYIVAKYPIAGVKLRLHVLMNTKG